MALLDDMARSYWTDTSRTWEIGLTDNGVELTADGYRRQPVKGGEWDLVGLSAVAEVRFGPFPNGARANGAVLYRDGEPLEVESFDGSLEVLPRMGYDLRYTTSLDEVD